MQNTPRAKRRPSFGGFLSPSQAPARNHSGSPLKSAEERSRSLEEWLKISADNKITGLNTWNLNLIDYFADMSLLRDGDSINFQKASYTLDGCVKVYTSRIDSVDNETKQLLLGLATTKETEESIVDGVPKKTRRDKTADTLVTNDSITMGTFELDFAQDPLFQKTASDFDQGGATGLLLSNLDISEQGYLIFGTSSTLEQLPGPTNEICDLSGLQTRFGARFGNIDNQVICPTFQKFMFNSDDFIEEFNMNFENRNDFFYEPADLSSIDTTDNYNERMEQMDESMAVDMDSHVFDEPDHQVENNEIQMVQENVMKMIHGSTINQNKYLYFDNIKGSQWVGPEHWKTRILNTTTTTKPRIKKIKIPIDFNLEVNPALIFQKTKTSLLLPKATLESKQLNLLGEDKQFNSKRFTKMFLKPEYNILEFSQRVEKNIKKTEQVQNNQDDYGQFDNGFDDDDHGDDLEFPTSLSLPTEDPNIDYSNILNSKIHKPKIEPLVFSRTAKRVDVQKLKENLWSKIVPENFDPSLHESIQIDGSVVHEDMGCERNFMDVCKELDTLYEEKPRKDISVAFCFICVLHLANENNLDIIGSESLRELTIKG